MGASVFETTGLSVPLVASCINDSWHRAGISEEDWLVILVFLFASSAMFVKTAPQKCSANRTGIMTSTVLNSFRASNNKSFKYLTMPTTSLVAFLTLKYKL